MAADERAGEVAVENGVPLAKRILLRLLPAAAFFASSRPASTTAAPAQAMPFAMPSPIPPLPPVMIETRPERPNSSIPCTSPGLCVYSEGSRNRKPRGPLRSAGG